MATENIIKSAALNDGMPDLLADLIVAQTKHETGNYTSDAFRLLNNAIGYSWSASSDWQLPDPGFIADNGAPLGDYATVQDSVHELTHWIRRRQDDGSFPADLSTITSAGDYAAHLKNASHAYYQDSITNYTNGILRYFKANVAAISISGLFIAGIIVLLILTRKRPR